jgi:hypothetical protein
VTGGRLNRPVRLGGVYTLGLGDGGDPLEESARNGTKLSAENRNWIAQNCDVIALNAVNITPETFPAMQKQQPIFTPLLYVYASSLYEQPDHRGSVGLWKPEMAAWTLRDADGKEVTHPDAGGHWMDFGSMEWAAYWRQQVLALVRQYGAQGSIAAELPVGNTFVESRLAHYKTSSDRMDATADWLQAAHAPGQYLLIPSALGFEALVGRPIPPVAALVDQPALNGRGWDYFYPFMDGAWAEGWVRPYWLQGPLPEKLWEMQLEAADRAARDPNQVFIASAAYRSVAELEFALASYLLVWHKQGRMVFQPMPVTPGTRADAGFSLAVLRRETTKYAAYFDALLGGVVQERHLVRVGGGNAWRRAFENGVVYVNSDDRRTVTLSLGGALKRLNGTKVRKVSLAPHSGVILLYK